MGEWECERCGEGGESNDGAIKCRCSEEGFWSDDEEEEEEEEEELPPFRVLRYLGRKDAVLVQLVERVRELERLKAAKK